MPDARQRNCLILLIRNFVKMKTFNLDDPNEVEDFVNKYRTIRGRRLANMLEFKGFNSVKRANFYSLYAWNKWTAMALRKEGKIALALGYEAICDRLYKQMPDDIKW